MEGRGGISDSLLGKEAVDGEARPTGDFFPAGDEGRLTAVLGLSTLTAVCGFFIFGNVQTYSSPAENGIRDELGISSAEYSVFGSMLNLGGLFGALCSGKIADLLGRRGAMWVTDISSIVGWLAIIFAENAWMLDIGRLFLGFGVGVIAYVAPVFIAEMTPKNLRGTLAALNMLMSGFGGAFTSIIGVLINWRILALLGIVPCLLQFLLLFFVPESPRWLAKMGLRDEVEAALQQLRGENVDVSNEAMDIEVYTERLQLIEHKKIGDLFQQKYARALIVGIGTMALQQLSGLNGYAFYMSSILEKAGASSSAGIVISAILSSISSILAVLLMDKFGRRPLLLVGIVDKGKSLKMVQQVSLSGSCLGNCITGLSFLLQDYGLWTNGIPTVNFIGVMVFTGFYSIGTGGIPWIIMSEIFPVHVKGAAGSIVNLVSWGGGWLVSFTFNYFFEWSSAGVFFVFSIICFVGVIFVAKMVPETKGRTLEEIQASMSSTIVE